MKKQADRASWFEGTVVSTRFLILNIFDIVTFYFGEFLMHELWKEIMFLLFLDACEIGYDSSIKGFWNECLTQKDSTVRVYCGLNGAVCTSTAVIRMLLGYWA
ncbi:hypothetical protein Tco_0844434 [Tanacetum coccineum]